MISFDFVRRISLLPQFQMESSGPAGKRRKLEVNSAFNQEDDDAEEQGKKLKLSLPTEEDKRVCNYYRTNSS